MRDDDGCRQNLSQHAAVDVEQVVIVVQEHSAAEVRASLRLRYPPKAEATTWRSRRLVRDVGGIAAVPSVVVRDELKTGALVEHAIVPNLLENFYAISVPRRFTPPLPRELLTRPEPQVLQAR